MAALVTQAVESGEYASNSEVIREALREWKQRRSLAQHDRERCKTYGLRAWPAGRTVSRRWPPSKPKRGDA